MSRGKHKHYMLDTNTVSHLLKDSQGVIRTRLAREPISSIFISVITEAELLYGLAKKPGATSLQKTVQGFLGHLEVLPWDSLASRQYASLRASTEAAGTILGNLDLLIAAHSLATGMVLVTCDRVFFRVKELHVEDWTA